MSSKTGKTKKGNDSNKMSAVERTFYELTVEDLNRKIARLKDHVQHLQRENGDILGKISDVQEDRSSEIKRLQTEVSQIEFENAEMEMQIAKLREYLIIRRTDYNEIFEELKNKHRAMNTELSSEIKLLKVQLHAIEEFHREAEKLLSRLDEQKDAEDEIREIYRETIKQTEEENIRFNNDLVDFMDKRIKDVTGYFMTVGETTISRRLVRENLNLQKDIDSIRHLNSQVDLEYAEMQRQCEDMGRNLPILEKKKLALMLELETKSKTIAKLTAKCEQMKKAQVERLMYRKQFLTLSDYRMCERLRQGNWRERLRKCRDCVDQMQLEVETFDRIRESIEANIDRVNNVLCHARYRIEETIEVLSKPFRLYNPKDGNVTTAKKQRKNLLDALMKILSIDLEDEHNGPFSGSAHSIIHAGGWKTGLGDLEKSSSAILLEIFRRDDRLDSSSSSSSLMPFTPVKQTVYKTDIPADVNIPKARPRDPNLIFDVVKGTSLIYSSSRPENELDGSEDKADAKAEEEGEEEESEVDSSEQGIEVKKESTIGGTEEVTRNELKKEETGDKRMASQLAENKIVFDIQLEEIDDDGKTTSRDHEYVSVEERSISDEDNLAEFFY